MNDILFISLSLLTCSFALTSREFRILSENTHGSITNGAFTIEEDIDEYEVEIYRISITGYPQHDTADCYMSQLECCRTNVEAVATPDSMTIYKNVEMTDNLYCTPLGTVGMSTGGTNFYNHLEAECANVNIMVDGTFDECNGHTGNNIYHFHRAPNPDCVGGTTTGAHIIGVSLDGFAIYNSAKYKGVTQELDECGGFAPDGDASKYRYVAEYGSGDDQGTDFVVPCFRAVPYENA
uniref:YHYH domain-containing protein n=1 Tax=Ciona savignyi TaxID=51511 RepID=H2YYZ5_CIOSA